MTPTVSQLKVSRGMKGIRAALLYQLDYQTNRSCPYVSSSYARKRRIDGSKIFEIPYISTTDVIF